MHIRKKSGNLSQCTLYVWIGSYSDVWREMTYSITLDFQNSRSYTAGKHLWGSLFFISAVLWKKRSDSIWRLEWEISRKLWWNLLNWLNQVSTRNYRIDDTIVWIPSTKFCYRLPRMCDMKSEICRLSSFLISSSCLIKVCLLRFCLDQTKPGQPSRSAEASFNHIGIKLKADDCVTL